MGHLVTWSALSRWALHQPIPTLSEKAKERSGSTGMDWGVNGATGSAGLWKMGGESFLWAKALPKPLSDDSAFCFAFPLQSSCWLILTLNQRQSQTLSLESGKTDIVSANESVLLVSLQANLFLSTHGPFWSSRPKKTSTGFCGHRKAAAPRDNMQAGPCRTFSIPTALSIPTYIVLFVFTAISNGHRRCASSSSLLLHLLEYRIWFLKSPRLKSWIRRV